ncbi:MAG: NuoI/complex I 23 kDa subunit family protein [Thermoproteus sp.]|jgi:NADH-quinone oxidoreductase subunit I
MAGQKIGEAIKAVLDVIGLGVKYAIKPERLTIYYPYEVPDYMGRVRGWIGLWTERCTSCMICARICPTNAIKMYMEKNGRRYPGIDYGRCIMCHYCIDACPTYALYPTDIRDFAFYRHEDMMYTPDMMRKPPQVPKLVPHVVKVVHEYSKGRVVKVRVGELGEHKPLPPAPSVPVVES